MKQPTEKLRFVKLAFSSNQLCTSVYICTKLSFYCCTNLVTRQTRKVDHFYVLFHYLSVLHFHFPSRSLSFSRLSNKIIPATPHPAKITLSTILYSI